jgi:molecular chaperone GrpE
MPGGKMGKAEQKQKEQEKPAKQETPEIKQAEAQQEELRAQYEEIKDTLQRVYAEFQNYRKRTDEDRQKFVLFSNEQLLKKILPIMDNFEMALLHRSTEEKESDFSKGMELIYSQFLQTLEDEGITKICSAGKFDPRLHEAVLAEESEKEDGTILQELQKGYVLSDRVLRPAKVKIAKNPCSGNQVNKNGNQSNADHSNSQVSQNNNPASEVDEK